MISKMSSKSMNQIVPIGNKLEKLATGYVFTEGPVWDRRRRCLLFCDEKGDKILEWSPSGAVRVFHEPSGEADALTFDIDGNLIICEYGNHCVSMIDRKGKKKALLDNYQGKRLNNPNDLVVRSDGTIYFTDSGHGVEAGDRELPGVYRYWPDEDRLELLDDSFNFPNGLAFSPDESLLYVGDTMRRHIRVFEVVDRGLVGGEVLINMPEDSGVPDGFKVDVEGNIYAAVLDAFGSEVFGHEGGIWVISPNGGKIGVISVPEPPANVAWGDEDWKTLYITATSSLYKIRLKAKGIEVY